MKKPLIFAVILAVVIGIPVSKKYFSTDSVKEVTIETIAQHKIKASILASGQLKHEQEIKLSAEVIGKVTGLFVEEGDQVTKGQIVLQIDDESYIAAVEQQQAVVNQQTVAIERQRLVVINLERQLRRSRELFKKGLLDHDAYEASVHRHRLAQVDKEGALEQLKQVKALLEQSKDRLSKTKVLSPIDGLITSLDIKEGETAISGTTNIAGSSLMTIANPNSMLAEVNIDEADIADVEIGQKAEIIAIAFADRALIGTVESIASSAKRALGRQSLSFAVKLKIEAMKSISLRPGMSCRAEVFTQGEQERLAVPIKAIRTEEDNEEDRVDSYVFIVNEGKVKKVVIETGISDDDYQEVVSGLEENSQLITGPDKVLRHLKDGEEVSILKKDESESESESSDSKSDDE